MNKAKLSWAELALMIVLMLLLYLWVTMLGIPFVSTERWEGYRRIPFRCVGCGEIVKFTIHELEQMANLRDPKAMKGPLTLECPKCHRKTLTQAVECPKCGEIFVIKMGSSPKIFDDRCPKCGKSYAEAWKEKYTDSGGQ